MPKASFEDEFTAEAKRVAAEEAAKQASRKRGGGGGANFVDVKWTGFTASPQTKVLRFLGKHPDLHLGSTIPNASPTDIHVVNMSRLIADNGKQMDLILPLYDREPNHVMWQIIDRVNDVEWHKVKDKDDPTKVKSLKVFKNLAKFPELYGIVNWSGLPESNLQRQYGLIGKGWKGKKILLANVIDREMMDWHRENKHTVMLCKKITYKDNPDGTTTEYVDKGISEYGFNDPLNNLRAVYGDWEKFDVGFIRKATKENPNEIFNACRTPEKVVEELRDLIVEGDLTEEERGWEQYDISKIFKTSSYTKILNRLRLTIERIDASFGTHYLEIIAKLANKEALARAEDAPEAEDTPGDVVEAEGTAPELLEKAPEPRKVRSITPVGNTPEALPGWDKLTEDEKKKIVSVVAPTDGDTAWKITFSNHTATRLGKCPDCKTLAPEEFGSCPGCGASFA